MAAWLLLPPALPGCHPATRCVPLFTLTGCHFHLRNDCLHSICSTHEFKYSSFHEGYQGAAPAPPPPTAPETAAQAAAARAEAAAQAEPAAGNALQNVGKNIKNALDQVAEAATAEGVGVAGGALQGRQRRAAERRMRQDRAQPAGVLYLNAQQVKVTQAAVLVLRNCSACQKASANPLPCPCGSCCHCCLQRAPAGVLHISDGAISAAELEAEARRAAETGLPVGAIGAVASDWKLGDLAEAVGRGVK